LKLFEEHKIMNKKVILLISLVLVLGGVLLWGCRNTEDIGQYIPAEVPVTVDGDRELEAIGRKIMECARQNNFSRLERYFDMSPADREIARLERQCDPVKDQLDLLAVHAQLLQDGKWQTYTLEKNSSVRILRVMTADDIPLSITLAKRKNGYRIVSVKLG